MKKLNKTSFSSLFFAFIIVCWLDYTIALAQQQNKSDDRQLSNAHIIKFELNSSRQIVSSDEQHANGHGKQEDGDKVPFISASTAVVADGNQKETAQLNDISEPVFIFTLIVYIVSTASAVITNLLVILVYMVRGGKKSELSKFLINLAVADFLMSTACMPFTFAQVLLNQWVFGEIMCPIVLFKQVFSVSLSIYTMVIIGINRYFAIKCPLKNRATNKNKNEKLAILFVWLISIALASVQLFVARVKEVESSASMTETTEYNNMSEKVQNDDNQTLAAAVATTEAAAVAGVAYQKYICNEQWSSNKNEQIYTIFNIFAVYLIPVFILGYTYTCIICIIKETTHPGNANASRDMNYTKSKNKVIKMLITLVCVFTLCWLPLHVMRIIIDYIDYSNWLSTGSLTFLYSCAHWIAMSDVYSLICCCKCFSQSQWKQESSTRGQTSLFFKRNQTTNTKLGYYNKSVGANPNARFLKPNETKLNSKRNQTIKTNIRLELNSSSDIASYK